MKELLDKLSSYNIFNNLFPGIIFAYFYDALMGPSLIQKDLIIGVFLYYFLGLIISRIGSLVIEPVMKFLRIVQFASYSKYISATKSDPKIELLLESNNMYRTFSAVFVLLFFIKGYTALGVNIPFVEVHFKIILIFAVLILFLISYRKQVAYIKKRVESNTNQKTV